MPRLLSCALLGLMVVLLAPTPSAAQLPSMLKRPSPGKSQGDTSVQAGPEEARKEDKRADTSLSGLMIRLEEHTIRVNKDIATLKRGFDTTEVSATVNSMQNLVNNLRRNFEAPGSSRNIRNLNSSKVALHQAQLWMARYQEQVTAYNQALIGISDDLASARADSNLRVVPRDSALVAAYMVKLGQLQAKWKQADSMLQLQFRGISLLQTRMTGVSTESTDLAEAVQVQIDRFGQRFFSRDVNMIWEKPTLDAGKGIFINVADGFIKNMALSIFFIINQGWPLLLAAFLALCLYLLNRYNLRRLRATQVHFPEDKLHFIGRSNILCVLLVFFTLSPFVLSNPPAGLVQLFWVTVTITAVILRWKDWPAGFRKQVVLFLVFFALFSIDSYILEPTSQERIAMLLLNIAAGIFGWMMYKEVCRDKSKYHSLMDESILLFIIINVLALAANTTGRFNLARVLSNSSALSISLLLALQIIREIILETIYLHAQTHRNTSFAGFLDDEGKNEKYRKFLGGVTMFFWLLTFTWSLNFYDTIYEWVSAFLSKKRTVGEFGFTYGSILIFIGLIWATVLAERFVSLVLQSEDDGIPGQRKSRSGSLMLFSKLGIYVVGFLLAFAAAGIPMDKMAIVLGALSVGIGFGLQTIINNLVSGIILAIEKPMEIGDVIELGTRMGTVKAIGFRSSQIATYDGSVIIVPNGDFIAQQLINWTHSNNNYRRVEIIIGVPYGSDLDKIKSLISEIINNHAEVARYPEPIVLVHQFGASSVDFRVLFWTAEFDKFAGLKSSVLQEIYARFKAEGIEIPFPQQDIHIRSVDPAIAARIRKDADGEK